MWMSRGCTDGVETVSRQDKVMGKYLLYSGGWFKTISLSPSDLVRHSHVTSENKDGVIKREAWSTYSIFLRI